jgi:predicted amidohydrolase
VHIDSDGTILGVHRKVQPTHAERFVWSQGDGSTLRTYETKAGYNLSGLCCWEHTMNGAREALIQGNQHVHAGAWPSLSTIAGFETVADLQIEALMKNHALTAQVFVLSASNYVDETCLNWLRENIGDPGSLIKAGGGWSAIIHPFCFYLAGPVTGAKEELLQAEIDLAQLGVVKVWVDGAGHYSRPELFQFTVNRSPYWENKHADQSGNECGPTKLPRRNKAEHVPEGLPENGEAS